MAKFARPATSRPVVPGWGDPSCRSSVAYADPEADRVREAMLRLAADLRGSRATVLTEAIGGGRTIAELFELRRPLMQAIAAQRGELHALRQIMRIDALVLASWPEAPVSRPAVLG